MHVLIASAIGLAAALLPSAAFSVIRSWLRQDRARRGMQCRVEAAPQSGDRR